MSLSIELPSMKRLRIVDSDNDEDDFEEPRTKRRFVSLEPHPSIDSIEVESFAVMKNSDMDDNRMVCGYSPSLSPCSSSPQGFCSRHYSYTNFQKERFDTILTGLFQDSNHSFLIDLFDLMNTCVAQGHFLPEADVRRLLNLSKSWRSSRMIHKLHLLLRQDLRLRPEILHRHLIDDINVNLNECLNILRSQECVLSIQLTLNYFLEVLKRCFKCDRITSGVDDKYELFINRTRKWSFFSKIIKLVFNITEKLVEENQPQMLLHNLRQDLLTFLCVPLCGSSPRDVVERIAFTFEENLRSVKHFSVRRNVLLLVPSDLLKEKIIDIHLENEFPFNPSEGAVFEGAKQLQGAPFSLMKFRFVHVCRALYQPSGEPHDLSYFLFLLFNLLQSHLLVVSGTQPISLFTPHLELPNVPEDFCDHLESIKPHIAGLIDRLSEDEVLLKQLFSEDCLSGIQSLSEVIDITIKSLEPSLQ